MTTRLTTLLRMIGVALLAMLLLATPAMAQDDDDDDDGHQHSTEAMTDDDDDDQDDDDRGEAGPGTATGSDDDRFGAFIRVGTCDMPGDIVEDIDELDDDDRDDDDDDWRKLGGDEPRPDALYSAEDDIGQTIDALAGGEFVVTVHEGESADSTVIACGAIGGDVDADGTLLIDLDEVDNSGFEGRAYFELEDDDDDDETEVTVGIWQVQAAGV